MDEMRPPETESAPPVPAPLPVDAYQPSTAVKPKTNVAFFLLGLATPVVLVFLLGWLVNVVAPYVTALGIVFPSLIVLLFFGFLAMFLNGKKTGATKVWSFAKGAMWAYAAIPLFLLAAFGTCLIGLGNL